MFSLFFISNFTPMCTLEEAIARYISDDLMYMLDIEVTGKLLLAIGRFKQDKPYDKKKIKIKKKKVRISHIENYSEIKLHLELSDTSEKK